MSFSPESPNPNHSEFQVVPDEVIEADTLLPPPGVWPATYVFVVAALKEDGAVNWLGSRQRNLLDIYYGTDILFSDLPSESRVTAEKILRSAMVILGDSVPPELIVATSFDPALIFKAQDDPAVQTRFDGIKDRSKTMRQHWLDPEFREIRIASQKGIPKSPQHRAKLSQALLGRPSPMKDKQYSDEHKQKMSESLKKSWEKRRNLQQNHPENQITPTNKALDTIPPGGISLNNDYRH